MAFSKKAEMGMGTLIIFIALVLVAAVAASVLISTTESLQNKALETGKETKSEVGTSLNVIEIYARDEGGDQQVENFYIIMKLNAGSEPIRFNDLLLTFNLDNQSTDALYNTTFNCSNESTIVSGEGYGVLYSLQGSNYQSGYLNKGDVVTLCLGSPVRQVEEGEDLTFIFVPKVGSTSTIETRSPDLIVNTQHTIYP